MSTVTQSTPSYIEHILNNLEINLYGPNPNFVNQNISIFTSIVVPLPLCACNSSAAQPLGVLNVLLNGYFSIYDNISSAFRPNVVL